MRAIGQVAGSLKGRGGAAGGAAISKLAAIAARREGLDSIVASGTLLGLGDVSQRGALRRAMGSADPQARRLAVELVGDDEALLAALRDPDREVRFGAARVLAGKGQRHGVGVLREVLAQGGVDGLIAYGLLRRLGEDAAAPAGLGEVLATGDLPTRVAAAAALLDLPAAAAVPLLRRAVNDSAAVVRRQVAEAAFALAEQGRGEGWELLGVLRSDGDMVVRTRAALLLGRLGPRPAVAPDLGGPALDLGGPALDLGGPAPVVQPTPPAGPQPEQLLQEEELALQARHFREALGLLDRAEALARGRRGGLRTQIWLRRGRIYEAQGRSDQALEEYGKLLRVPPAQRTRAEQAAVVQLGTRFGRLVVSQVAAGGRCEVTEKWVWPGECQVDVVEGEGQARGEGAARRRHRVHTVRLRAGQVRQVGGCT